MIQCWDVYLSDPGGLENLAIVEFALHTYIYKQEPAEGRPPVTTPDYLVTRTTDGLGGDWAERLPAD